MWSLVMVAATLLVVYALTVHWDAIERSPR